MWVWCVVFAVAWVVVALVVAVVMGRAVCERDKRWR